MKTNSKRVAHVRDLAATCGLRTPGGRAPEAAWNSPEPVSTSGGSFPLATALSLGLGITHNSRLQEVNPKGIPSLSPGLRAASYPGCEASADSPTLKGLKHSTRGTETRQEPTPRYNPFRVEHALGTPPRVARGSQPWAGGCNPVGIEERLPDLLGKINPRDRAGVRENRSHVVSMVSRGLRLPQACSFLT
jgi:hypothetical protein